jgi:hypothetical protein
MELLERNSIRSDAMYLMFNSLTLYIYVGKQCDPYYIEQVFKAYDVLSIDRQMSEEEMFADMESSQYLTALYNIIYQIRYQRQPFCELRILVEGVEEAEAILSSLLINDNKNPTYPMDFNKFLATITGGGHIGPGVGSTGGGSGSANVAAAAYY